MATGNIQVRLDSEQLDDLAAGMDEVEDQLLRRIAALDTALKAVSDAVFNLRSDMNTYDYEITKARTEAAAARRQVSRLRVELDDLSKRHTALSNGHNLLASRVAALESHTAPVPWTATYTDPTHKEQ